MGGVYSMRGRDRRRRFMSKPCTDEEIMLIWIMKKWGVRGWTGFVWFRIGSVVGFL
jgi:hypothetical protein